MGQYEYHFNISRNSFDTLAIKIQHIVIIIVDSADVTQCRRERRIRLDRHTANFMLNNDETNRYRNEEIITVHSARERQTETERVVHASDISGCFWSVFYSLRRAYADVSAKRRTVVLTWQSSEANSFRRSEQLFRSVATRN